MRVRLGIALVWGCLTAVLLYAVVRVVQYFMFPDPNPAIVVWSPHAGYFWRSWIVAYGGGLAAFIVFFASRTLAPSLARALPAALLVSAVLLVAQTLVFP